MTGPATSRPDALVTAHGLVDDVQEEPGPLPGVVAALVETAERNGWPEVGIVARCALLLDEEAAPAPESDAGGGDPAEIADAIVGLAVASGDPGLLAVGHAFRADYTLRRAVREDRPSTSAEADLVAAVVLLERGAGHPLERVFAHDLCGVGFVMLGLWELAIRQYGAAEDAVEEAKRAYGPHALRILERGIGFHVVEMHVDYACGLWAAGQIEPARAAARTALRVLSAHRSETPRPSVKGDSRVQTDHAEMGPRSVPALLARAIVGEDVAETAARTDRRLEPEHRLLAAYGCYDPVPTHRGMLALARALSYRRRGGPDAAAAAEDAVELLRLSAPTLWRTALDVAADIEGAPAAARLARSQSEKLWVSRRRSVASMEALLRAERLRSRREELERHAHVDDLTGLANRRGFYRYLNGLLTARRERVSLLVIDIDRFKDVNDRYGHPAGDQALRRLAGILTRTVRPLDLAARVGGDEFFLLFEGTGLEVAIERAQAVMQAIAERGPGSDDDTPVLSVTIGVASGAPEDFDRLLADADVALYRGKSTGGGRWVPAVPTAARNPT